MVYRVVVGHPNRHHLYEVAHAYQEVGALKAFVTERFFVHSKVLDWLSPAMNTWPQLRRMRNYTRPAIASNVIIAQPQWAKRAMMRIMGGRIGLNDWTESVLALARDADAVHLPCCHALGVFRALRGSGKKLILEQYTGDRRLGRATLLAEAERMSVSPAIVDAKGFDLHRIELNEQECELADHIVVGSAFVHETLLRAGISASKLTLAQYGCDIDAWPFSDRERAPEALLQVAMVGSGAFHKGITRTLKAARRVSGVQVHVFGNVADLPGGVEAWSDVGVFYGHVPHADLLKLLRPCHAFALPSVWEGSACAVGEAMAVGLPVIVSPNAGSWARDGEDGYVVPVGDEESIVRALERMKDEPNRRKMGFAARRSAEKNSWAEYRAALRKGCLP